MSNFMKLQSRSYHTYYDLLAPFDLKMTDFCIASYLIPKVKSSAKFGEHGKDGKCFYRHDKRVKGLYYSTTLSKIIKNTPFHLTIGTLENSLNRLQNKYGIIYKHQTIRTKDKNGIQIFMPILDNDVRKYFNDKSYKTVINLNTLEGRKFKNRMSDLLKSQLSFCQNLVYRSYKNWKNNNDHITNHHIINHHVCNDGHGRQSHQSNQFKIKSMGLPTTVINLICKHASNKHEAISYVTDISKNVKEYIHKKDYYYKDIYNSDYFKNETNPYFQKGGLLNDLKKIFTNNSDLVDTLRRKYKDYISSNTNFKLKNGSQSNNNNLAYTGNDKQAHDKFVEAKHQKDLLVNGLNHAKTKDDKNKIQDNIQKYAHLMCKYSDYSMEFIHGTKEYKDAKDFHPTSETHPKLKAKLDKEMNNDNYEDANGVEHASVNNEVFKPTKKQMSFSMDQFNGGNDKVDDPVQETKDQLA